MAISRRMRTANPFLRHADRTIITFDVPGATDTVPVSINLRAQITGQYTDANSKVHGFVREPNGTIQTFSVPNSSGTFPTAMNARGEGAGVYFDSNGDQQRFVTSPFSPSGH